MALENLTPSNRLEAILDGGDVTPSNRREYFIQKAMSAGGGSDLPEYTSADKGKVLTIGEGEESVTTVIVPEQSVTMAVPDTFLVNVDYAGAISLANGTSATLVVNDAQIAMTAYSMEDAELGHIEIFEDENSEYNIVCAENSTTFSAGGLIPGTTYTVSLSASVPSVEPKWDNVFPPLPTANGNYLLTISNGTASWTSQNQ